MRDLSHANIDAVYHDAVDWFVVMVEPSLRISQRNALNDKIFPQTKNIITVSKITYVYINELMLQQKSDLPSQQTLI